ncbi:MAG TPA: DUF2723 domain-containing protein [bacterium]|nr:DUF2723 domain-containing protein [bacterium]
MSRRDLGWAAAIALASLVVWGSFAARDFYIGDSTELAGAAANLGVAHPPGYPSFTLVSHLFLGLGRVFSVPPALAGNVLALLAAALGAALLWLGLRSFGLSRIPALIGTLAWVCGPLVTGQALTYEVHALQHLLLGAAFFFAARAVGGRDGGPSPRDGLALCLVTGLLFTNHYSAAVLLPVIGWCLWRSFRGAESGRKALWIGLAVAAFIIPLSAYLYLPLRAGADQAYDYGMAGNLPNLWAHLTGKSYAYSYVEGSRFAAAFPAAGGMLFDSIPWPLWALVPLGLAGLFKRSKGLAVAGLLTPVLVAAVLFFYRIVDPLDYLSPLVMLAAVWVAFGAEWLKGRLGEKKKLGAALVGVALALGLGWWAFSAATAERPLSGDIARAGAQDTLRELTPGALYFGEGDDVLFGPLELTAEGLRPDAQVLDELGNLNRGPLGPVYPTLYGQVRRDARDAFARRWAEGGGATHLSINAIHPLFGIGAQRPLGLTLRLAYPDAPGLDAVNRPVLPDEPWRYQRLGGFHRLVELETDDTYLENGMGFTARLRGLASDRLTFRAVGALAADPLSPLGPGLLRRALDLAPASLVSLSRVAQAAYRGAVWGLCALETGASAADLPVILPPWFNPTGGAIAFRERLPEDPRAGVVEEYLKVGIEAARAARRYGTTPESDFLLALFEFGLGDSGEAHRLADGIRAPSETLAPLLNALRRELDARREADVSFAN